MKKGNIIVIVVLVVLCLVGWISMTSQVVSEKSTHNEYIAQADEWANMGLYQRAVANYKLAIAEDPALELYEKAVVCYTKRYAEAPEDTLDELVEFLEEAVSLYPAHEAFVDELVMFYTMDSNYAGIYSCVTNAVANGYDAAKAEPVLLFARYAFELRRNEFTGLKQSSGVYYAAARNNNWNLFTIEDGYLFSMEYENMSAPSAEGVCVVFGNDARLVDATGLVMGIFGEPVEDAGIYAEGLIPVSVAGKYAYYDEFAAKQFGDYDMAGTFQNGVAAVQQSGQWTLVDTQGNAVSDSYSRIILDNMGRYLIGETMLVQTAAGQYSILDAKQKVLSSFTCDDADILTEDGLIAVCVGGKWGFVDLEGNTVLTPAYEQARSFSNGLAAVCQEGKWGFIDPQGNLVIDYQFADVGYMNAEGYCPVRTDLPQEEEPEEDLYMMEETEEEVEEETVAEEPVSEETVPEETAQEEASQEAPAEETVPEQNEEQVTGEAMPEAAEEENFEAWKLLRLYIGIVED